jgi:hypothetical protein
VQNSYMNLAKQLEKEAEEDTTHEEEGAGRWFFSLPILL